METSKAEELLSHLLDVVDFPPYDESDRLLLSRTLAITSLHFAASVRNLCEAQLPLGAAAVLRSQYEAAVRAVWVSHCASDVQVDRLSALLSLETQQAAKNLPQVAEMLGDLEEAATRESHDRTTRVQGQLLDASQLVRSLWYSRRALDQVRSPAGAGRPDVPHQQWPCRAGVSAPSNPHRTAGASERSHRRVRRLLKLPA